MSDIYLSYRFQSNVLDAFGLAGTIAALTGPDRVVVDRQPIPYGVVPGAHIKRVLGGFKIVLVLINQRQFMLDAAQGAHRQKARRREIERGVREIVIAMELRLRVVPVILGTEAAPMPHDYPSPIQQLARLEPAFVNDTDCAKQVGRLLEGLRDRLGWTSKHHPLLERAMRTALFAPQPQFAVATVEEPITHAIQRFCRECIIATPGAAVTATELFQGYCSWCERYGLEPIAVAQLGRLLADQGMIKEKIAGRIRYLNVELREAGG